MRPLKKNSINISKIQFFDKKLFYCSPGDSFPHLLTGLSLQLSRKTPLATGRGEREEFLDTVFVIVSHKVSFHYFSV